MQAKLSLGGADAYTAHQEALGALYQNMQRQSSLLAYIDNFRWLGYLALLCVPLVLLFHGASKRSQDTLRVNSE
jgi:DHA2 family multidrug resistance protein